jgi:hypothetical protein
MPVEPLVLAALFGCEVCFATPVDYQMNMLIISAATTNSATTLEPGCRWSLSVVTLSALLVVP